MKARRPGPGGTRGREAPSAPRSARINRFVSAARPEAGLQQSRQVSCNSGLGTFVTAPQFAVSVMSVRDGARETGFRPPAEPVSLRERHRTGHNDERNAAIGQDPHPGMTSTRFSPCGSAQILSAALLALDLRRGRADPRKARPERCAARTFAAGRLGASPVPAAITATNVALATAPRSTCTAAPPK